MTLRDHFDSYLDPVRWEDRYRTFADLERCAGRAPFAVWRNNGASREIVFGARTIISGWGAILPLLMQ